MTLMERRNEPPKQLRPHDEPLRIGKVFDNAETSR
jgi:hypothetical protein